MIMTTSVGWHCNYMDISIMDVRSECDGNLLMDSNKIPHRIREEILEHIISDMNFDFRKI